ncbi:hypothetical protein H8N03_20040 [Ramlibacter sp. USB13]|uniref:Uncharacterized protein n=1 Tax=Ramlibacter cellulosilyticus TaxID=2764187 RepID=A0A923SDE8_9BURK|nr:hypothetical protein [Ramlibacter cellulosilyticus]MBC5785248.1 hypothetical protein [Ramlibacter cellulosilyticus]
MEPNACFPSDAAPRQGVRAPVASPLRLTLVALVWGVIGFIHVRGAPLPVAWTAIALSACLGVGILHLAGDDTRWTSMLAAVLLAISPLLRNSWDLPQGPLGDRVMLAKTLVIVCGLLLLSRLSEGRPRAEESPDY